MSTRRVAVFVVVALGCSAGAAGAQALRLGLGEVLERAAAESHLLKAGDHDLAKADAVLRKARLQRLLPEAKVNLAGGLTPEARGTVLSSPDASDDLDGLGPYYRLELKLVQPLWTFGRLDALEMLARRGVAAERARRGLTGETVAFDAARAYWALAAAARGGAVARSMRADFDELLREVEQRLADENSGVDDADLLEVRANAYSIDRLHLEARDARRSAAEVLRALLALPDGSEPEAVDEPSPEVDLDEAQFGAVASRAVENHREVRALAAAVQAQAAKVDLQRKNRHPVFFIAGGAGYARAANRDRQDNPWVQDSFNFWRLGAELGLAWDANLWSRNVDVSEAEAEQRALEEKLAALRAKTAVDVRRALRDAVRDRALLDSARTALQAAKSRLRLVLDNWATGLGEVGDVLDAYEKYYGLRAEEPQREYELNVALARLGFVLGDLNLYLEWVRHGKFSL